MKVPPDGRYWVTRDSDIEGNLSSVVDIWIEQKPDRWALELEAGAVWMPRDGNEIPYVVAVDAARRAGVPIPVSDRECFRVG